MILCKRCVLSVLLLLAVVLLPVVFPLSTHAASSVYIPGVPSAGSSAMGISCNANGLGPGTLLCINQSPGPIVTCNAGVCSSSAGFQNRLMFTPGSYNWSVPSGVTKMRGVGIGAGAQGSGNAGSGFGGTGGGYSEKSYTVVPGQSISVTVGTGGGPTPCVNCGGSVAGGASSLTINGVTITATGGGTVSQVTGGCGSGGDINTCGGNQISQWSSGTGAGGPYANGGNCVVTWGSPPTAGGGGFGTGVTNYSQMNGQYGGYAGGQLGSSPFNPYGTQNEIWWDPRDIVGNGATYVSLAGLGGGGAPCVVGNANPATSNGGFGGGSGTTNGTGNVWTSGGVGGGGANTNFANSTPGGGGPGIVILYW